MPILFALVGATGVGKTKLSIALAKEFHAQIISMDSRQIYKGFCIGTAQPSAASLTEVPHHLVNFLSPLERYSVGEFVRNVKDLLKKDIPYILVGGTGMYLQALTEGLAEIPKVEETVRADCEKFLQKNGLDGLYQKVLQIDPHFAREVKQQDRQRLLRAFEIFEQTGRRFSDVRSERAGGIGKVQTLHLCRLRTNLYAKINHRVREMVRAGWKSEVAHLMETVPAEAPAWQSLGYREWADCIRGQKDENEVIESVCLATRHYAKRQITWFRHQTEAIQMDLGENFEENFAEAMRLLQKSSTKNVDSL